MKGIPIKIFFLLIVICSSTRGQTATDSPIRYFMQSAHMPASEIPYGANNSAGRYVNVGDARIYYEVYGEGAPLVILHGGIVGSLYEMGQFIDSLAKTYQVIAVSTRGHGRSEPGSQSPTYQRKAEDVRAIIDVLTVDSVTVLGFSDGAYTGYFLAALHPKKVKKLIAIGAGEWKEGYRKFNNSKQSLLQADSIYFKQQLAMMPEPQKFADWLIKMNTYYNSVSIGKETLTKIKCPVLLMAGELDQNAPLQTICAAYQMIPRAQLSIIPAAPHPVFLVNFPAVWTSISPFLRQ